MLHMILFQIPKLQKHKPVPKTTYQEAKEQDILTKARETNRRKAEVTAQIFYNMFNKYSHVNIKLFNCCFFVKRPNIFPFFWIFLFKK